MTIINLIKKMDEKHALDEAVASHKYWSVEWHDAMQSAGQAMFELIEELEKYGRAVWIPLLILSVYFYMRKLLTSPYFEVILVITFILILALLSANK